MPLLRVLRQCLGSRQLDAAEGSAVDVAFDFQYPRDEGGIGHAHTHTPARHVMTLRQRVELDAAVLGSRHLHQRQVFFAEDEGIGIVVDDDDAVVLCKLHQPLVSLTLCPSACRHIGIVGPHQFHTRQVHLLQCLEIRLPAVILAQVVVHDVGTENLRQRCIGGIAGVGYQHLVAGVDESQRHMEDALLGADERLHLRLRVDCDTIPPLVKVSHGLSQLRRTHRGLIAVGIGLRSHLAELVYRLFRRRHVRTTDGKADDVLPLSVQLCYLFQFA